MMGMLDIAAGSIDMHQADLQQAVQISVMKKAMDSQELAAQEMIKMLPPSDHLIDVYA